MADYAHKPPYRTFTSLGQEEIARYCVCTRDPHYVALTLENRLALIAKSHAMPAKKLTEEERLVDEQMLAIIEWASDHPTKWHNIGKLEVTQKAAALLAKRGVLGDLAGD